MNSCTCFSPNGRRLAAVLILFVVSVAAVGAAAAANPQQRADGARSGQRPAATYDDPQAARSIQRGIFAYEHGRLKVANNHLVAGLRAYRPAAWYTRIRGMPDRGLRAEGNRVLAKVLWELGDNKTLIYHVSTFMDRQSEHAWTCLVLERERKRAGARRCWADYEAAYDARRGGRSRRPARMKAIDQLLGPGPGSRASKAPRGHIDP